REVGLLEAHDHFADHRVPGEQREAEDRADHEHVGGGVVAELAGVPAAGGSRGDRSGRLPAPRYISHFGRGHIAHLSRDTGRRCPPAPGRSWWGGRTPGRLTAGWRG